MSDDLRTATEELIHAFGQMYLLFYRRRDPRAHRPSAESLAVLEHLAGTGPLTVTEAARHFDRSQSAMSEILERMIQRGVLDRIADERDRRRHLIWLTEKGRDLLAEERQVLSAELVERALGEMTERERESLDAGLRALLAAAERARRSHPMKPKEK